MINLERLRDIREDHDLSQEEMAFILQVKRSRYSLWELGINIIPLRYLSEFADYFKCSIDYALGLTNIKDSSILKKGLNKHVIGQNIKELRIKNKLSQEYLASKLNVTQACITRYEKGLIEISIPNLYNLSKEFKVSMNYLCGKDIKQNKTIKS